MSIEGFKPQPKPLPKLDDLLSETPVHGIGYERFTPEEKTDLDALFSNAGTRFDDPALEHLKGEALMDMMDYVRSPAHSPARTEAAARIKAALAQTQRDYDAKDHAN